MNNFIADIKQALSFVADGGVNQKWYASHALEQRIGELKAAVAAVGIKNIKVLEESLK